jgi:hypothetical protein
VIPARSSTLRHSFGTALAADNVDVRTISALMRHRRLSTTEIYMAYTPRHDLADRITRAVDLRELSDTDPSDERAFWARLEEEVPAKWLGAVRRIARETGAISALTAAA